MFKKTGKFVRLFKKVESINLILYKTYAREDYLYVKGRVLDNKPLVIKEEEGFLTTIKTTFKQFNTYEVENCTIRFSIPNLLEETTKTNAEGYFVFSVGIKKLPEEMFTEKDWFSFSVTASYKDFRAKKTGKLLVPSTKSEFGVISDIDDTILQTGVTSFFKWQLIKNSLFTNVHKRIPLKGAPEFYRKLHQNESGHDNPFFYLSNTPWNMYQYLDTFLSIHQFPKGAILLRYFPNVIMRLFKKEKPHKQKEIINILKTYPDLKFVLIGDSGEHDATIYIDIARQYPQQIKAIFLRSVDHKKKMQMVKSIVDAFEVTPVFLVDSSTQAIKEAKKIGLVNTQA
ncbi:App1 family protein [Haloflavibacter putidus]|uniref:DUF2183 domain-containing protein n=1 Tax=Haloflavibacter putidus TaxID=2576776 RepID=A0A507ZQF7_9FLAO|nr:phosphatase domain-containing protein [Haloflavibacter putidus]TQD39810.1 DUF2183 domain-containing protein [Haloflavibacter putidus]